MPIEAIGAAASGAVQGVSASEYLPVSKSDPSGNFATQLTGAVDFLQGLNGEKDTLAMEAMTGDLDDIHRATISAARSSATLELFTAVRNKGVDAFTEIMRMQA